MLKYLRHPGREILPLKQSASKLPLLPRRDWRGLGGCESQGFPFVLAAWQKKNQAQAFFITDM